VAYKADDNEGLKSYSVPGGIEVTFDTSVDSYSVTDAITVDDEISLEQFYYQSGEEELTLDEIYADYYEVEIDYTESGKVGAIYYLGTYYVFNYDSSDRLVSVYKDAELLKSVEYNAAGKIVSETNVINGVSETKNYSYKTDGSLYSVGSVAVVSPSVSDGKIVFGDNVYTITDHLITRIEGAVSATFAYEYLFNGVKRLTEKTINGETTNYSYLGDKVVEIRKQDQKLCYILDNNLNYVGLKYEGQKYYFDVDPFGNVLGLFDCDGQCVVQYFYDIWGTLLATTGDLADTLGLLNEVMNLSGVYEATLNAYFIDSRLYLPSSGIVLANGADPFSEAQPIYEWNQSKYFARSAVTDFAKIHDKVVSVAVKNLKEAGLDVVSNLYAVDEAGNEKRLVDIYTLDYSITPFSAMNLIDGNQIYEVIYHSPDSMAFETIAANKLRNISQAWAVSYFAEYKATPGTMKFNGQFVYCGYLIDYKCDGAGIVEYQVKINKKSNYDQSVNIYDYDEGKYVCYVNNTFDLDFLDGVTIIPGISRETYDIIDEYLSDYLQTVAGDICDQMLIYDDPAYYDME
ncbi:MAG: hypothetical protein IKN50_06620, partial [Clostridia bacterium]|nr:hypothetical protein [Clostridia bacterium]